MKQAITNMLNDLDRWAECPGCPYDKENYHDNEIFLIGLGAFISPKTKVATVTTFHAAFGVLLNDGRNAIELEGEQDIGLVLMVNKIVDLSSEDVISEGVLINDPEGYEKGPLFTMFYDDEFNTNIWIPEGEDIPAVSLDHILSVMLYAEVAYDAFLYSINQFFIAITKDEEFVNSVMERIVKIREKVALFEKRELH